MLSSISSSAASARCSWIVRDRVARDDHLQVADVGVERRVEHALLGDLADQHHALDVVLAAQVLQRRLEEDRVARLDHEQRVVAWRDRLDEVPEPALQHRADELVAVRVPRAEVVDLDTRPCRLSPVATICLQTRTYCKLLASTPFGNALPPDADKVLASGV